MRSGSVIKFAGTLPVCTLNSTTRRPPARANAAAYFKAERACGVKSVGKRMFLNTEMCLVLNTLYFANERQVRSTKIKVHDLFTSLWFRQFDRVEIENRIGPGPQRALAQHLEFPALRVRVRAALARPRQLDLRFGATSHSAPLQRCRGVFPASVWRRHFHT